jgi:hypothetical protein
VFDMGELADRLGALVVRAASADGKITATVRGNGEKIVVAFLPGSYQQYTESDLARQLSGLATRAWARRKRAEDETIAALCPDALGPADDGIEFGRERRAYRQRLERLGAGGMSSGGRIRVASRGLVRWKFVIAAGTVRTLSEGRFLAALEAAVDDLLTRYQAMVLELRDEIYGLGVPRYEPGADGSPAGRRPS